MTNTCRACGTAPMWDPTDADAETPNDTLLATYARTPTERAVMIARWGTCYPCGETAEAEIRRAAKDKAYAIWCAELDAMPPLAELDRFRRNVIAVGATIASSGVVTTQPTAERAALS